VEERATVDGVFYVGLIAFAMVILSALMFKAFTPSSSNESLSYLQVDRIAQAIEKVGCWNNGGEYEYGKCKRGDLK